MSAIGHDLVVVKLSRRGLCAPKQRGREVRRRAARLICVVVVAGFLFPRASFAKPAREVRRVLIINDLGIISSPGFAEVDRAVLTGLEKSPYRIELYQESLDLTLFPDRVSQDRFREEIIQKYSTRMPDVIIAVGPESLKFIVELYDRFQDVPIIFCAIWGGIPDQLRRGLPFTGVLAQLHPEETLNAALHLLPSTKHVVVVGGVGKFDEGFEAIAKQSFHSYESKLEFNYLVDLSMPALLERLKHLPSDTIVYHTAISEDAAGDRFIDSAQSIPMVASAANAPVFVMDDVNLRAGTVGGDLVNWADDGRIAAEMAVRVLNGEKPQDIPVVTSNHVYMFDWRALKRWGLKERDLPAGSIVINRQPTMWELYKWYVIAGVSLFIFQALLIFGLLWQRAGRLKSEKAVRESEERFRLVANTAPVLIWMSGRDKLFTYFNQPWLEFTGLPMEVQLGNGWAEFVHPEDWKSFMDTYTVRFDRREQFHREYRLRRRDGEYRWVLDIGVPRLNPDGSFAGYIGSCIDVTERKIAQDALAALSGRLIEAQDEERKRIAREIHDDYNQRLAVLAIDLEELAENVGESSGEGSQKVHELFNRISELGADLHSLSHRLHSSTLESLGLVAGLKAFCAEFSDQQGIQVDFASENVPRGIPGDMALCIFRIAQEALRNVKRHSGANRAEVRLEWSDNSLHLSVFDRGRGFDSNKPSVECGIGIRSMEERLRLLGGQLEIHTRPMEGSRIHAWLPFKIASERAG
jgi:PAS domain S-box-containing protein